ncbi:MAG: hypothetical protein WC901_04840 [Candidatus Margulisiibacteriota bacterium]
MGKMSWWKIVLSLVLLVIVAQVIHTGEAMLTMKYYIDPARAAIWSKIMCPNAGPPPTSFYYYSLALSLVSWFLFMLVYAIVRPSVPGVNGWQKGAMYGLLIWLVAGLPGMLSMLLLVNLPWKLVAVWIASMLIIDLVNGAINAAINK